jgi:hypothetical protein
MAAGGSIMTTQEQRTEHTQPAAGRPTPLDELKEVRHALQDTGITLLQAATAAISAAAKGTLTATTAVIAAAEDTLAAAEEKVRKLRSALRNRA